MDKLVLEAICVGIVEIAFCIYMSYRIVQEAKKK